MLALTPIYIMSDQHRTYKGVHLRLGMRGHSSVNHSRQFTAETANIPVDPLRPQYQAQVTFGAKYTPTP